MDLMNVLITSQYLRKIGGGGSGSIEDNGKILQVVDGYLIGGPNLVDGTRTLTTNAEADESNIIKFKDAPRAIEPGELVGRWVLIAGCRGYIGENTFDTLALFTDETKTETLNITCPSGTIIYPADINVDSIDGLNIRTIASAMPPAVTVADEGKFLRAVNGAWAKVALTDVSIEGM